MGPRIFIKKWAQVSEESLGLTAVLQAAYSTLAYQESLEVNVCFQRSTKMIIPYTFTWNLLLWTHFQNCSVRDFLSQQDILLGQMRLWINDVQKFKTALGKQNSYAFLEGEGIPRIGLVSGMLSALCFHFTKHRSAGPYNGSTTIWRNIKLMLICYEHWFKSEVMFATSRYVQREPFIHITHISHRFIWIYCW